MKIGIMTNKRERYIGDYLPEINVFRKNVKESKHLFRKLDAWGIDGYFFTEVLLPKNALIHIWESEMGLHYRITAKEFKKYGRFYHFNKGEDNKAQIFCPRHRFTITGE